MRAFIIALVLVFASATTQAQLKLSATGYEVVAFYHKTTNPIRKAQLYSGEGNATFTVEGGTASEKDGLLLVYPTENKVVIHVLVNGQEVGQQSFVVRTVPKPSIWPADESGQPIDLKNGISAMKSTLSLSIAPDEDYAMMAPQDANYQATMTVTLARGRFAVAQVSGFGKGIDIKQLMEMAQPDDRLVIEVTGLNRTTSTGELVRVPCTEIFTVSVLK